MLLNKIILVKWDSRTKKHYEEKGYIFTRLGDEFKVKAIDLSKSSHKKVEVKCDCPDCKNPYLNITWKNYRKCVKEDGKYYCNKCNKKLYYGKILKTKLKNSTSFEYWCYENLDIDYANEILSRWDTEMNGCLPSEITYSSRGFNKKGYWFKCNRGIHKSELKNIGTFTLSTTKSEISSILDCNQCNSFGQYLLDTYGNNALELYWDYDKNNELKINPFEISKSSSKKIYIKCTGKDYHESNYVICNSFYSVGSRCPYCRGLKTHPKDSLGQYIIDNYGEEFLNNIWSEKNKKSAFEYAPKSQKKVWWKCPDGKHEDFYRTISNSRIADFRCPECQSKLGEIKIAEYLINNNIEYTPQKKFKDLYGIGHGKLSYDFYLPNYNILLEFQGKQHEEFVEYFHRSIKGFEKQQEHDLRKREYAKLHNINLLEIWYYDYNNIEKILSGYI